MDLNSIDIKIENEDQTLIVLCSLSSYETFFHILLYEKVSILLDDISNALK